MVSTETRRRGGKKYRTVSTLRLPVLPQYPKLSMMLSQACHSVTAHDRSASAGSHRGWRQARRSLIA